MKAMGLTALAAVVLSSAPGCGGPNGVTAPPPAQTAAIGSPTAPGKPTSRWSARIVDGVEGFAASKFARNGDVVAITSKDVWLVHPTTPPTVKLVDLKDSPTAMAVATGSDRAIVRTRGGVLHVLGLDGVVQRTVDTKEHENASGLAISADGRTGALESSRDHTSEVSLYDLESGKALGRAQGTKARFHPSGEFVLTSVGVFARDGSAIAETPDATEGEWIGDRAAYFSESELFVVDAPKKATVRLPASCPGKEPGYVQVDVLSKRAVRLCHDRAIVINLDKLARAEVKFTRPKWLDSPIAPSWQGLAFGQSGEVVSYWIAEEQTHAVLIDPTSRTAKATKVAELPPLRDARSPVTLLLPSFECRLGGPDSKGPASLAVCNADFSRDGSLATWVEDRALFVHDAKSGESRARFGRRREKPDRDMLELREREGALDVVTVSPAGKARPGEMRVSYRVGPPARSEQGTVVQLGEKPEGCAPMKGVHLKKIGERTLAYDFGFRSPCMCEADGTCIQMKLPDRVAATDITSKYGIGIRGASRRPKGTEVVLFHLDGSIAGERTLDVSCPVFTVDERRGTAASVCSGRDTPEELVELELPSLVDKRRVPLSRSAKNERGDKPPMIGARTSRVSWAGSLLLIERPENQAVDAELFHADTVAPFARLLAFKTFGVVTFADGKLERFGQVPADYDVALVCTDGKQVAPYATCQSEVEVKGRFRVP